MSRTYVVLVLHHPSVGNSHYCKLNNSKPTKRHSLGGILVDLLNKDFTDFTASRLDILLMLENMLTMSKLKYYLYLNLYKQICTIKIVNTIKQMV